MGKLSIFEMVIICLKWFIRQIDQLKEDLVECETSRVNWKDSSDAFEQENAKYKVQLDKCEKQLKTQRREQRAQTLKALELHDKLKSIN